MDEATLTTKSQLTLPKRVREALGVGPGDRVRFVPTRRGFHVVSGKGDIGRLQGIFAGRRERPLSVEEMDAAIAEEVVRRSRR